MTHSVTCLGYMRNHGSANARVTLEMQVCFKNKNTFQSPPIQISFLGISAQEGQNKLTQELMPVSSHL